MNTLFINTIKKNKKFLMGKVFFGEQFDAAVEILKIMASDEANTNHIILDSATQSGKTSVMEMVYRILNFNDLYEKFGIDNVIYMTADNGSGKGALKYQTKERFENHWINYIHTLPIEFLKRSDFDKYQHTFTNTLIIIDESQYGWREVYSKGQRMLQYNGVNFISCDELQTKNTFILSVSATTQNERYGDSDLHLKPIVKLKTGNGYVGFDDFFEMGVIKPVYEENFINTYEKLDSFLGEQSKKLKRIYKETGVAKCIILRLFDNKKKDFITDSEEFKNIANNNGFNLELVSCKESKIDYSQVEQSIFYNCNLYKENGRRFHLIVIKNAFSYGITIKPLIKKLIATCYDVRKDLNSTEATEQGLLGRMSGYGCNKKDFAELDIYINETHYNGLKENRINGANEYSSPLKKHEKTVKVKCEKNEWNGDKKNIVVWNNKKRTPLIFEGEEVDSFFKKHKNDYDFKKLFQKEALSTGCRKESLFGKIIYDFLNEFGIGKKYGFNKTNVFELRRKINKNDYHSERICTSDPIIGSLSRPNWQTEENANNESFAWGGLIDLTNADEKKHTGIVIKIPYGNVGFSKLSDATILKEKKRRKYSGYDTTLNKSYKKTETVFSI